MGCGGLVRQNGSSRRVKTSLSSCLLHPSQGWRKTGEPRQGIALLESGAVRPGAYINQRADEENGDVRFWMSSPSKQYRTAEECECMHRRL